MNQAVTAARRAGYRVDDYGRLVSYLPCSGYFATSASTGDPIRFDTTWLGDGTGTHTLAVRGYTGSSWDSEPITVTFLPP